MTPYYEHAGITIYHGDCREIASTLRADVVITDPPYNSDAIPLYGDLARLSATVLPVGGSVLAMSGQSFLPAVLQEMHGALCYQWMLGCFLPGGQAVQIWPRHIQAFWKPVLWFTNGPYTGRWVSDVLRSPINANDKRYHHWGQNEVVAMMLVDRFSEVGDVVLDPFVGGASILAAAKRLGRKAIGIDIHEYACEVAAQRLAQDVLPLEAIKLTRTPAEEGDSGWTA